MSTHREDLALERLAVSELEYEAQAHWQAGRYGAACEARREAQQARERVRLLEQEGER